MRHKPISGDQLRAARAALKVSQREMGELASLSEPTIKNYEAAGNRNTYASTANKLEEALEEQGILLTRRVDESSGEILIGIEWVEE